MTIRYEINSKANFLLYVIEGHFTAEEYFQAYYTVHQDPRRHHGMNILIDILEGELDFTPSDLKKAVALMRENRESGYEPDHLAVLTRTTSFDLVANTLKLMADEIPVHLKMFHTFGEAIQWLKLGDHDQELRLFWQSFKKERK